MADEFKVKVTADLDTSQLEAKLNALQMLASGEISHLLSGENDQSQSDRNNQCISFSFL